jgi:hypothetical protein
VFAPPSVLPDRGVTWRAETDGCCSLSPITIVTWGPPQAPRSQLKRLQGHAPRLS